MSKTIGDIYTCAACRGFFKQDWTKEEVMKESKELFGDISEDQLCTVCDDCFKMIIAKESLK